MYLLLSSVKWKALHQRYLVILIESKKWFLAHLVFPIQRKQVIPGGFGFFPISRCGPLGCVKETERKIISSFAPRFPDI